MIAINLAAASVELGVKPLVVCQDPQGTSILYFKAGNLPFEIMNSVPSNRPDADIVIFDHQASDWEVPQNYLIVMPLKPVVINMLPILMLIEELSYLGKE